MKTVGRILQEARLGKKFTLADVEKGTKILQKFLVAIETDDYSALPSVSYAKGFVKNYSDFLGLNSKTVLAFFRRQTVDTPKSSLLPTMTAQSLNRSFFQLTPTKFMGLVLMALVSIFLVYLGAQYRSLIRPPNLVIESPSEDAIVREARIDILGKTDPDATVTVNNNSVIVRDDGKFFDQVALSPGVNTVTIVATSRMGKTTTLVREVGLTP